MSWPISGATTPDDDRAPRHAARAVLEMHPAGMWRAGDQGRNCHRAGLGLIALARAGAPGSAGDVMNKVMEFDCGY